jgi:ubiquinol-cytochrome c reductase cytochrome c subunit
MRRRVLAFGGVLAAMATSTAFFMGSAGALPKATPYTTGRANAGTPNSSVVIKNKNGTIVKYGNGSILYTLPPASLANLGDALYQQNCASCHGTEANGVPASGTHYQYPDLRHVGPAAVTFWVDSGRMPATNQDTGSGSLEPPRRVPRLSMHQAEAIAAWIDSLSTTANYPFVPAVNLKGASVSDGAALFALNCAACHTITGDGDALAYNTFSPSLRHVPSFEVAEAIRTGPGNMPRFSGNLSDAQVRDIVDYVTKYIQHPDNPGGLGLGGLGPVGEGFVGLALGVGLLCLAAFWVGDRS